MWFRNLQVYRLVNLAINRNAFADMLVPFKIGELGAGAVKVQGWAPVRPESDGVLYDVGGQWLLRFDTDEKILPTSVINRVAKARAVIDATLATPPAPVSTAAATTASASDEQQMTHAEMIALCSQNPALASGLPLQLDSRAADGQQGASRAALGVLDGLPTYDPERDMPAVQSRAQSDTTGDQNA